MRRAARRIVALWMACTWAATLWLMSLNPFAQPVIERSAAELRIALQRAMAVRVTADWLVPRLIGAVVAEKPDDIRLYLDLAAEHAIPLPRDLTERANTVLAAREGALAVAADCAVCAYDITECESLALIGACAIPVEMTPVGDLNALRRAGVAWASGEDVDGLDAGLALVGLAASGAILVSGGTSASAKVGATLLRLARRMGALGPRLAGTLTDAVIALVRWERLPAVLTREVPVEAAVDAARWSRLTAMAENAGTLQRNTSAGEALVLLRGVDSAEDLARLARVAEAAGPETRKVMAVLGSDAFRLLSRVSRLSVAAIGLVTLAFSQLGALVLSLLGGLLRRLILRPEKRGDRRPVA